MDTLKTFPKLKESYYNFKLNLNDGGLMLYNTKTGGISLISSQEKDFVLDILNDPNGKDDLMLESLVKCGYIVDYGKNELYEIERIYKQHNESSEIIHFTIIPTEMCNFICPYCYVHPKREVFMEDWVFESIYKHIERRVLSDKSVRNIEIKWFGGEPLLSSQKIIKFMNKINELRMEYPFKVQSTLATNGYLLTASTFEELLNCGILVFQVTLDGDKDNHDKLRILKNGDPTFDVIYGNLKNISRTFDKKRKFKISIRANFMKNNLNSMEKLMDKFILDFEHDKRVTITFRPVLDFETTGEAKKLIASDICSKYEGHDIQNELAYNFMKISGKKSEFSRMFDLLPRPTVKWCNVSRLNSSVVNPEGLIFACDSCISDKNQSIGKITSEGEIMLNIDAIEWKGSIFDRDDNQKCLRCKLFPVCLGGCRRENIILYKKSCYWTEKSVYNAMKKYVDIMRA